MQTSGVTRKAASAAVAALAAAALATGIGSVSSDPGGTAAAPAVASGELELSDDGAIQVDASAPADRHLYSNYL